MVCWVDPRDQGHGETLCIPDTAAPWFPSGASYVYGAWHNAGVSPRLRTDHCLGGPATCPAVRARGWISRHSVWSNVLSAQALDSGCKWFVDDLQHYGMLHGPSCRLQPGRKE